MMSQNAEVFIAKLKKFVPHNVDNSIDLSEMLDGLDRIKNADSVIPAMFELMEKYPDADLGTPGALVHNIERIGGYETQLIQSVERVPTYLNVWMVNRILNGSISNDLRERLIILLKSILNNPNAGQAAKESAQNFIEYQRNLKL